MAPLLQSVPMAGNIAVQSPIFSFLAATRSWMEVGNGGQLLRKAATQLITRSDEMKIILIFQWCMSS
jgi:hypothetical protein